MPPTPLWLMPRENEKTPTLFIWVLLSFHCLQKSGRIRARRGGNARQFFFGMSEAHFLELFHGGVSFLNKLNSFFHWLPKNCKILAAIGGNAGQFFFLCLKHLFERFRRGLGPSRGSLEALWGPFGGSFGGLERALRPTWRHLGPTWRQVGATWRIFVIFWEPESRLEDDLGSFWSSKKDLDDSFWCISFVFCIFYSNTPQHWKLSSRAGESSILEIWSSHFWSSGAPDSELRRSTFSNFELRSSGCEGRSPGGEERLGDAGWEKKSGWTGEKNKINKSVIWGELQTSKTELSPARELNFECWGEFE